MQTVRVNLGPRSYDIALCSGGFDQFGPFISQGLPTTGSTLIVCDTNTAVHARRVASLLDARSIRTAIAVVPSGEESKSLSQASRLYDALYDVNADRRTAVIAVGGGVVGDLAGFVAATYNRGLPLVMIPTTMLAMVDSSVGGKTGVNHPKGKNLIGAFHQPSAVWIDTGFLDTLPAREFHSGLAEVVKYGVILDADFFDFLEVNAAAIRGRTPETLVAIIARCCRIKAAVVEQDEREETGLRAVLNYGHTFAHAFETVGGYGAWLHGEAVAAGMIYASRLAERRKLIDSELTRRQCALLEAFSLPLVPRPEWNIDEMIAVMRRDKKAVGGRLRFILPVRLGEVKLFDDVPEVDVRSVLEAR